MPVSVLVVDDDPGFRDLASRLIAELGLTVVGRVGSVADAIAVADALRPQAALVDFGLPDGDGLELAAVLTARPWRPRVVVISSDPEVTTVAESRAAGAIGFLAKTDLPVADLRGLLAGGAAA